MQSVHSFKSRVIELCKGYTTENIFNADETALFYRQLPTKSLNLKVKKAKGCRLAKDRLSLLLCCSLKVEKLKPLIVGIAACPRIFRKNKI